MDFEAVQIAVGTDSILELVFFFLMLTYLPFGLYQVYLMFVNILTPDSRYMKGMKPLEKPNNIIVVVTTNGMATDVVEKIIKKIKSYSMGIRVFVIKEYRDTFEYDCDQIVVPKDYKCPNSSRNKMRAMQYGIEVLHSMGYGKETYICHLDDDSVVDEPYLEFVANYMSCEGGQGCIRLRAFGRHLFSSLCDVIRISNCEAWCKHCNKKNKPQFVHGEGIVIRADVEYKIGWDYGTYGAEDLIMGLKICETGVFCHIPMGNIYIAPPTTVRDYYKQRRRWFWSVVKNDGIVRHLSPKTFAFYMYMYFVGFTGLISMMIFPILVISNEALSSYVILVGIINLLCFYSYYQFGAARLGSVRYCFILFILQIPVAIFDGLTVIYALLFKPDFSTFETIKKV